MHSAVHHHTQCRHSTYSKLVEFIEYQRNNYIRDKNNIYRIAVEVLQALGRTLNLSRVPKTPEDTHIGSS